METLRRHGVEPAIVPEKAYVMKRLVNAFVESLTVRASPAVEPAAS